MASVGLVELDPVGPASLTTISAFLMTTSPASNAFLTCALVRGVMLRPSRPFWPFFGFLAALRVIGERGEAIRNGACSTCTPPFEAGTAT